jgi:hypothetical protein
MKEFMVLQLKRENVSLFCSLQVTGMSLDLCTALGYKINHLRATHDVSLEGEDG